jgi:hypothetical protein
MDWLTFFAEVFKSLAWPVAVLIVVLFLREYLGGLLTRLRLIRHGETTGGLSRVRAKNYTRDWSRLYSPLLGAGNVSL